MRIGIVGFDTSHVVEFTKRLNRVDIAEEQWVDGAEVVVGRWEDERIGSIRGTRAGTHGYGFTVWCENEVRPCLIDPSYIYRELLKEVVGMFESGIAPLDIKETIEIVAFIEAAAKFAQNRGQVTPLFD